MILSCVLTNFSFQFQISISISKMEVYLGSVVCHFRNNYSEENYFEKGGTVSRSKYQRKGSKEKPGKITVTVLFISKGQTYFKGTCKDHCSGILETKS